MLELKLIPPKPGRSKFYRVRGSYRGKRIDQTTGTTDAGKARLVIEKIQRDLLNGVLGIKSRIFAEAAISYIDARNPQGSQRDAIIGAPRKRGDGPEDHTPCLVDWFGHFDCRNIGQEDVNAVVKEHFARNKHGRPYKPGTIVRQVIQPLTCVLNYAQEQGWCEKPHFVRPKFNDARSEYATPEEAARILRAASPNNRRWYLFSMLEGSRPSETLDLDWKDVWLDRQWAVLRNTKDNQEDRGIALHPQIIEMLSRVPDEGRVGKVFKTNLGKAYAQAEGGRGYKTGWQATKRRAGITRDVHVHDLRHTFGTLGLISGMPRRMIEEQMGHCRHIDARPLRPCPAPGFNRGHQQAALAQLRGNRI